MNEQMNLHTADILSTLLFKAFKSLLFPIRL